MSNKFYFYFGISLFMGGTVLSMVCDALDIPAFLPMIVIISLVVGCIAQSLRAMKKGRAVAYAFFGILGFLLSCFDIALFMAPTLASMAWMIIACVGLVGVGIGFMQQEQFIKND